MLSEAEKIAALSFRAEQQGALDKLNEEKPPTLYPHVLIHHVRHECGTGRSVSFEMRERYILSPDGRFAWIYREGRCADCGTTGRSRAGRLVYSLIREPAGRS